MQNGALVPTGALLAALLALAGPAAAQGLIDAVKSVVSGNDHAIAEAHLAKARQDLDTLRNAITLHDSQNRPLTGTSFQPVVGRYLEELPTDPWGNAYLLDANIGVIVSAGSDGKVGGEGEAADVVVRYKSHLKLQRTKLHETQWGAPKKGSRLELRFNKPFVTTGDPLADIVLILDEKENVVIPFAGGAPFVDPADPERAIGEAHGKTRWGVTWAVSTAGTEPEKGVLVLEATAEAPGVDPAVAVRFSPHLGVNLVHRVVSEKRGEELASTSALRESPASGGPADPKTHGPAALATGGAFPLETIGAENRGLPLERGR